MCDECATVSAKENSIAEIVVYGGVSYFAIDWSIKKLKPKPTDPRYWMKYKQTPKRYRK